MSKIVLLLTFVVATCFAYDFNDATFNELLLDNFKYINDNLDGPKTFRFRRDTDSDPLSEENCKWKKYLKGFKCCNDTFNPQPFLELLKVQKECLKEIRGENDDFNFDPFSCEKLEEMKIQTICVSECVARKRHIVDDNGNVIRNALIEHMKSKFSDDATQWKLDASENIIDKCLEDMKSSEFTKNMPSMKCNPSTLMIMQCMWKEYEKACPNELQIESQRCTKLRERLDNGENIFFPRLHDHIAS